MSKQIDIMPDGTPVVSGMVGVPFSLASSDEPGKVKIDPATGVMEVNPDLYSYSDVRTNEKWANGNWIYRRSAHYLRPAGGAAGDSYTLFTLDYINFNPIRVEGIYHPDGNSGIFLPIGTKQMQGNTVHVEWDSYGAGNYAVRFIHANTYPMNVIIHVWYTNRFVT